MPIHATANLSSLAFSQKDLVVSKRNNASGLLLSPSSHLTIKGFIDVD